MPQIIAHRGASHEAPENTLAAVRLAWQQDADAVEVDVRLTSDNHVVCLHDPDLRRTAGGDGTPVAQMTLEQVREADAGLHKGTQWVGERVPTLAEVLATVPSEKRLVVEIKCGVEIFEPLRAVLAEAGLPARSVAFISFSSAVCVAAKEAFPKHAVLLLSGFERDDAGNWQPSIEELVAFARREGLDGLDLQAGGPLDAEAVRAAQEAGLELVLYTIDEREDLTRAVALGVDGITTNVPNRALQIAREK